MLKTVMLYPKKPRFHTRCLVSSRSSRTIHTLRDSIIRLCTHGLIVHARTVFLHLSHKSTIFKPRIIYKLPPFATSRLAFIQAPSFLLRDLKIEKRLEKGRGVGW